MKRLGWLCVILLVGCGTNGVATMTPTAPPLVLPTRAPTATSVIPFPPTVSVNSAPTPTAPPAPSVAPRESVPPPQTATTPPTKPAPTAAQGGDVHLMAVAGANATVTDVGDSGGVRIAFLRILDPAMSTNQFEQPAAGKKYIAVELIIENTGAIDTSLSSFPYILRASDGFEYHADAVSGVGTPIDTPQLTPGGKHQGFVVFEVPVNVKTQFIRYKPDAARNAVYFDFT